MKSWKSLATWRILLLCSLFLLALTVPVLGQEWIGEGRYFTDEIQKYDLFKSHDGTSGIVADEKSLSVVDRRYKPTMWMNLPRTEVIPSKSFSVLGTTNLPPGTPLSIALDPQDLSGGWDSCHTHASGSGKVFRSTNGTFFSGAVNTSDLFPGEYTYQIFTTEPDTGASVSGTINVIPAIPLTPGRMYAINWSRLKIPALYTYNHIKPEFNTWWILKNSDRVNKGDLSYGSVIYCAWDGICRVYDRDGIQYYASYDGSMGYVILHAGSCISVSFGDNVWTVDDCNGHMLLTQIDEHMWDWES
jgi:hypothetical protein